MVNSSDDVNDGACDATHCSLREAINAANANAGTDTIAFDIPGAGPHTIQPASALPTITDPVIIDGYTQPGASPNTNGLELGSNAVLKIELDGSNAGAFQDGLTIIAGGSTVRGLAINRFDANGILLLTSDNNAIEGNFIGTDVTGTAARQNRSSGIVIQDGIKNTIGGSTPATRNLISGNVAGVGIGGIFSTSNQVLGNYIGTDATGGAALPNVLAGVGVHSGGSNTIEGNVISGNSRYGVGLAGGTVGNQVIGNLIGTDATGTAALGNSHAGVFITDNAANNSIGGTTAGAGNTIAFNGRDGVILGLDLEFLLPPGTGNAVLSNSIFSNTGRGIDLDTDGVTLNDVGDGDTGVNDLQNFPVLTLAASGSTAIEGTLNSTPNTDFRIEFFSNAACDPSGHGEGENFLGFTTVTTDGSGNAAFGAIFGPTVPVAHFITATATDPDNNTSEFSQCIQVTQAPTPTPPPDEQINVNVVRKHFGDKLEGTCWRISYGPAKVPHDVVGDDNGGIKPDCGEPSNLKLFDKDPAPGVLRITITSAQRVQFGDIWRAQMSFEPGGQLDTFNYTCDLSLGKCEIGPVPVGGLAVDLDGGQNGLPLEAPGSSGGNAGILAGVVAAATALALGTAAWYARRRGARR